MPAGDIAPTARERSDHQLPDGGPSGVDNAHPSTTYVQATGDTARLGEPIGAGASDVRAPHGTFGHGKFGMVHRCWLVDSGARSRFEVYVIAPGAPAGSGTFGLVRIVVVGQTGPVPSGQRSQSTSEPSSPVRLTAVEGPNQPPPGPELDQLYRHFEVEMLVPLWTEISGLMPRSPSSDAVAHMWRWKRLYEAAARSGELVEVGRGGERRAIALANPGLGGEAVCDSDAVGGDPVLERR